MDEKKNVHHGMYVSDRHEANLSGITDVRSFDEQEIVLETEMGVLLIRGSGLHIGRLTLEKGEVDISGKMDSFLYTDKKGHGKNGESIWARLLR